MSILCRLDLTGLQAQPFVDMANAAINSIKPNDINEIKANKKPTDIIKLIFDGLLILFMQPLLPVNSMTLNLKKTDVEFIESSFFPFGQRLVGSASFLKSVATTPYPTGPWDEMLILSVSAAPRHK